MIKTIKFFVIFFSLLTIYSCDKFEEPRFTCSINKPILNSKINGASILQTWKIIFGSTDDENSMTIDLEERTNSNWVSLSPLIKMAAYNNVLDRPYNFRVSDEIEKMKVIIPIIKRSGLKNIMLKPLTFFWEVNGSTYWGDFYVETEEEWIEVENAFEELIYEFAKLSLDYEEVKLLSIGNELTEFSRRRPEFFTELIVKLKNDFPSLQLTYSANWDEYQDIEFWGGLDYIGVNPYFPLVNEKTPSVNRIEYSLLPIKETLYNLSCKYEKPILFTEYGFRSIDYGLWESWNLGEINQDNLNFEIQKNGYNAFYNTFWDERWVAGGFFWEWKVFFKNEVNNPNENGWYVNDKPAEEIIKNQYE